jgi:hypothetical protein
MENKKLWFRRKVYGWGWFPVTWEGWVVIIVWATIFTTLVQNMDHEWLKNILFVFISIGILIYICYKKGEAPKWQWGKKGQSKQD